MHTCCLTVGSHSFATKQNFEVQQGRQIGSYGVYYTLHSGTHFNDDDGF